MQGARDVSPALRNRPQSTPQVLSTRRQEDVMAGSWPHGCVGLTALLRLPVSCGLQLLAQTLDNQG